MPSDRWKYPVKQWSDLTAAIAAAEHAGAVGTAHLMRALAAGRIAYLPLSPDDPRQANWRTFTERSAGRPAIALIGDDDGIGCGPAGWPSAGLAVRWARAILLHATGAELWHYEGAILAAQNVRRLLIVECTSVGLDEWTSFIQAVPHPPGILTMAPPPGQRHPATIDPGRLQ